MIKKKLSTSNLWWLDFGILGLDNLNFYYNKFNNLQIINISIYFFFFLLQKKNLSVYLSYILDSTIIKHTNKYIYTYMQTHFYDNQILIKSKNSLLPISISSVYSGNNWVEREIKEFNNVFIQNMKDSRKLLLNYNYNTDLQYNNYNNIINDISLSGCS